MLFKGETFLQGYSGHNNLGKGEDTFVQKYQTDPANRGFLVLSTYGQKKNHDQQITTLECPREDKEVILDSNKHFNQFINYKYNITSSNTRLFEYIVQKYNLTIQQDFFPPIRTNTKVKLIRTGTLNASHLGRVTVDEIIRLAADYEEFSFIRLEDLQGKDPDKTYFGTVLRDYSKYEQGLAALRLLIKETYGAETVYWPISGFTHKFWVTIDRDIPPTDVIKLLGLANRVHTLANNGKRLVPLLF